MPRWSKASESVEWFSAKPAFVQLLSRVEEWKCLM